MTETTWTATTITLSKLKPWERNPKRISKAHAARLLDLWERLGQFQTIAIGPGGEVYDGHQRLSVLKAKHGGSYQVQVLQASRELTEAEREELTIAAHSGTTGSWDWDALAGWDVGNLTAWGLDEELLNDWNAGATALREMLAAETAATGEDPGPQVDKAAELQAKWSTSTGQLWQLGEHRLICGDCTDAAVVARVMGGEKAQVLWADPPFGIAYTGHGASKDGRANKFAPIVGDAAPDPSWLPMWLPEQGAVYLKTTWQVLHDWETAIRDLCRLRAHIIWDRCSHSAGEVIGGYATQSEIVLFASTGEHRISRFDTDVWRIPRATTGAPEQRTGHPYESPVELPQRAIENSSEIGHVIADPFLGSGTTLIACERLGRRCRAVEIDPGYVAVALERWATMTGQTPDLLDGAS